MTVGEGGGWWPVSPVPPRLGRAIWGGSSTCTPGICGFGAEDVCYGTSQTPALVQTWMGDEVQASLWLTPGCQSDPGGGREVWGGDSVEPGHEQGREAIELEGEGLPKPIPRPSDLQWPSKAVGRTQHHGTMPEARVGSGKPPGGLRAAAWP